MKEIKFRVWDKESSKMTYYSDLFDFCNYFYYAYSTSSADVIMQFTGLKDKNGKEIYVGDVVKQVYIRSDKSLREFTREVIFDEEFACFTMKDEITDWQLHNTTYEIIGNIYENPELLKS